MFVRKRKIYDKYILKTLYIAIQRSQIEKQNDNDFIKREEHKRLRYIKNIKIMTIIQKSENLQFAWHQFHAEK